MIGIYDIASYVPENRIDNIERKEIFGVSESFLRDKVGVLRVSRKNLEEETSDLCCRAFEKLSESVDFNPIDVEVIVVCTQTPDYSLPHVSAIVHDKIELDHSCAAFDISLGCSGYVYGLSVVQSFMKASGMKNGLFFTADPYSKIINEADKNTALIFGDAATVTLISEDPVYRSMKFSFGTKGSGYKNLICKNGTLKMNGREIFNFAATIIPDDIGSLLAKNHLAASDIDLYLFHQGSKFIIDFLTKRIDLPKDKVPYTISEIGNTVSSSIPIMLEKVLDKKDVKTILISGFGVGLSWASGILKRER